MKKFKNLFNKIGLFKNIEQTIKLEQTYLTRNMLSISGSRSSVF